MPFSGTRSDALWHEKRVALPHEWNRAEIKRTIMEKLGWKKTEGHVSTWHNDCKLHPFMNFVYSRLFGCTKDCWGYCGMINAGQMTREVALARRRRCSGSLTRRRWRSCWPR